jgi:hypothetical protein
MDVKSFELAGPADDNIGCFLSTFKLETVDMTGCDVFDMKSPNNDPSHSL